MSKLRVVSVHGISEGILKDGFASGLHARITEKLQRLGVIPKDASEDEIAHIITFSEANYSSFGDGAENKVLNAYLEERNKLYDPIDKLLEGMVLDQARHLAIRAVSDVFVYQNPDCQNRIRNTVVQKIKPSVGTGDAVTLIGHSLGSVVAYDVAYWNVVHNPEWTSAKFMPTNLFTMGSPIALFALQLEGVCEKEQQKAKYDPEELNAKVILDVGKWYNFMDAQDMVAYPLQLYFKDKYKVEDVLVNTATFNPFKAHSDYWNNDDVATRIAERLKLDYERINNRLPAGK